MHITIGIFGDNELAKKLGKPGTTNDIMICNHADSAGVLTYVCPNSDKIQPLLQSLAMIDFPVIVVKEITKEIGEIIIAIDEMDFQNGFIIGDKNMLEPIIRNTGMGKFPFISEDELMENILKVNVHRSSEPLLIPIDNYFDVKSVGTVILGIMKSGSLKKYDKAIVEPLGKEVIIKGIQSQDNDFNEANAGMRVGLNLKGVEADELKRGFVICNNMKKSDRVTVKFRKSRFFRNELKSGMPVFLSCGLQVITSVVESCGETLVLKLQQPVAYTENQHCIIASQNEALPRIIGSGTIQ
ncbi:MAG: EF-Tu/IF-2/RF-3 family GTPase [Candidatus Aenigmatarchaeota archaeon]